jgi:hypothetical protein
MLPPFLYPSLSYRTRCRSFQGRCLRYNAFSMTHPATRRPNEHPEGVGFRFEGLSFPGATALLVPEEPPLLRLTRPSEELLGEASERIGYSLPLWPLRQAGP